MQSRQSNNSKGVDISKYQGDVDFQRVKNSGISFVIIKCTEGLTGIDPMFSTNLINAKQAGLKVGVYHFSRANDSQSAIAEAQHFISTINQNGGFQMLDIAPAFDIETKEGSTKAVVSSIAITWIETVKQASNMQPLIYSYPSFITEFLDETVANIPLWLAAYGVSTPNDRGSFTTWTFLQYSESGQVDGIDSPVDLNEYNGNIEDYTFYTEEDLQMIQQLQAQVQALITEVENLKKLANMPIPDFAKEVISRLEQNGTMKDPDMRSYDLYATLAILGRNKVL